jgi:hypothetical protein
MDLFQDREGGRSGPASWPARRAGRVLHFFVGFQSGTFSPRSLLLEGATMANNKGGSKSSKTAASKSLKEKRQAKKAKATRSGASSMGTSTNK